jgi:hypothetical protein
VARVESGFSNAYQDKDISMLSPTSRLSSVKDVTYVSSLRSPVPMFRDEVSYLLELVPLSSGPGGFWFWEDEWSAGR